MKQIIILGLSAVCFFLGESLLRKGMKLLEDKCISDETRDEIAKRILEERDVISAKQKA